MIRAALTCCSWWLSCFLFAACAFADPAPRTEPEAVGLSSDRLALLDEFVADKVREEELAGAVILVARHGKIVHLSAAGSANVESRTALETDSIFRWYSMTKPITAVALMILYEEGRFQLSEPLEDHIPEFRGLRVLREPEGPLTATTELERKPTIHDSLRHTAGFSHGIAGDTLDTAYVDAGYFGLDVTLAGMMTRLAALPLRAEPGVRWEYSVGPDIDARLVEVISGQDFDEFLEERLFEPLGMQDTAFWLGADDAPRLAAVHWLKDGKLTPLDAEHGAPDWVIADPALVNSYTADHPRKGGSYGLVGTAEDYWRFAQMIQNGGELAGARILSPRTVEYMLSDHLAPEDIEFGEPGQTFGLGFAVLQDPAAAGFIASPGSASWGGAATTAFWIDRKEELVIVVMTQHFDVPAAGDLLDHVRSVVYGAIEQ